MGGYEFIGWERFSYYTSNAVFSSWIVDHIVFLGVVAGIFAAIAKVTPWKWDEKLVADVKAEVKEHVPVVK
jgi:hypothetical protein